MFDYGRFKSKMTRNIFRLRSKSSDKEVLVHVEPIYNCVIKSRLSKNKYPEIFQ